ncbi:MAG: S-methyl-5-thioribose-1-phosphate isomerase, partial [Anaerolineae bacterium]|nr:S-methyl-5-thioribose-1-phosphate isomerase [Anaerolineae bacterium]
MRTIWWDGGQVMMINQRILPLEHAVVSYSDYHAVATAITDMVIRGAPAIGAAGGFGMALAAQQSTATSRDEMLDDLVQAKQVLDAARPTAVNLAWATSRLLELAARSDDIPSALLAEAQRLADQDVEINQRMGANGAAVVPHGANILHHCNTGSLASVDYGTALGVVRAAWEQGNPVHVWVDETRPQLQG